MGLWWQKVKFQDDVPDGASIKAAIERLTGLAVAVRENIPAARHPGAFAYTVSFECSPGNAIDIECHGPDGLLEDADDRLALFKPEDSGLDRLDPVAPSKRHRAPECGKQACTVRLEGYVAQEPTILYATILALESLGGVPDSPLSDETRNRYAVPVSRAALRCREWRMGLVGILLMLAAVVVAPFLFLWHLLRLPFELRRMRHDLDETTKRVDR